MYSHLRIHISLKREMETVKETWIAVLGGQRALSVLELRVD
uniref:Uncharacterized protein n=1 Tax=Anguilla anguilla TaxID=7936 RepID=A0A0E9R4T8_ANGAN